jgi:hypothetical protein
MSRIYLICDCFYHADKMEASNVEFRLGEIEQLSVADNSINIIMSKIYSSVSPTCAM